MEFTRKNASSTDMLDARDYLEIPAVIRRASLYLYKQLSGDFGREPVNRRPARRVILAFKPNMLLPLGGTGYM